MVSPGFRISRRQALKSALAAGTWAALVPRVHGSVTDAAVTTATSRGTVYAQHSPAGPLLPLFGIATVTHARSWSADSRAVSTELCRSPRRISVFTDLGDGRPIDIFKNPFNGHLCRVLVRIEEIPDTVAARSPEDATQGTRRIRLPWYPWLLMQHSPGGLVVEERAELGGSWRDASFDQAVWNRIETIARL